MTPERWARVERAFQSLCDAEPDARPEMLERLCGSDLDLRSEVESLLRAHAESGARQFETGLPDAVRRRVLRSPDEWVGRTIGAYRLESVLGAGGMGTVYLGRRSDGQFDRQVAVKLLRRSLDADQSRRRFDAERRALARLEHEHIARLLDGGVTDEDAPYLVMEFVGGKPIDRYCNDACLSIGDRLRLFENVCAAVQFAHSQLIVHRDLKPANILVDDGGAVKLLDFGIAKALTSDDSLDETALTLPSQRPMTPQYASPEQIRGEPITIATDVYSLGVVLYELLTGQSPYRPADASLTALERAICEEAPPPPSAAVKANPRALRGDLDEIVLKALRKEPAARYPSVDRLADDIRKHLSGYPVAARRGAWTYRASRFVRRNRALVGTAAAVIVALALGLAGTSYGFHHAERRREQVEKIAIFQSAQLASVDAEEMGRLIREDIVARARNAAVAAGLDESSVEIRAAELEKSLDDVNFTDAALKALDKNIFEGALTAIDEEFGDQPLVRARLLQTTAETMMQLGLLNRAVAPQMEALAIRKATLGDDHPDTLTSVISMGRLLTDLGRYDEALEYSRAALDGRRRVLGGEDPDTLSALIQLGLVLDNTGRLEESLACHREALDISRRVHGDNHRETLTALNNLGSQLQRMGQLEQALPILRESRESTRRMFGPDHRDLVSVTNNLAATLVMMKKFEDAEPLFRESLDLSRRLVGEEHFDSLTTLNNLGYVLQSLGREEEGLALFRKALEISRRTLGDDHPNTLASINNVGSLLRVMGRLDESEPYTREVMAACRRIWGETHPNTLMTINNIGELYLAMARYDDAERYLLEAMAGSENLPEGHPFHEMAAESLCTLYDARHAATPNKGYGEKAAQLRSVWASSTASDDVE